MEDVIVILRESGPLFGPLLFLLAIGMTWGYHSLLRQVSIRLNRIALLLVEKDIATIRDLHDFEILQEVAGFGVREGIV